MRGRGWVLLLAAVRILIHSILWLLVALYLAAIGSR